MDGGHVALVPTLGMPQAPSKNYMGARSKKSCIGVLAVIYNIFPASGISCYL